MARSRSILWVLRAMSMSLVLCACGGLSQESAGDGWRVLISENPDDPAIVYVPGPNLFVAQDEEEFNAKWDETFPGRPVPGVDFGAEMVVYLQGFSNADCPDYVFDGYTQVESGAIELHVSTTQGRACRSFGTTHAVFLALETGALPDRPFELRLGEGPGSQTASID